VRAFSQYLMRDDLPRAGSAGERYGGFRLPLVAERGTRLWGLVRPASGSTTVRIEYRQPRLLALAHARA
jgi:hypothetical protein